MKTHTAHTKNTLLKMQKKMFVGANGHLDSDIITGNAKDTPQSTGN